MNHFVMNQNHHLKESIDRGDHVVPVYLYENNWESYELYLHWHDEMEWIIVDEGCATFNIEGKNYDLYAGDCLLISPRQLHSGRSNSPTCKFRAILIDMNFLASKSDDILQTAYIDPLLDGQLTLPVKLTHAETHFLYAETTQNLSAIEFTSFRDSLNQLALLLKETPHAWTLKLKAALMSLIAQIEADFGFEKAPLHLTKHTQNAAELKQLLAYMKRNCHEKMTLDALADWMKFNPQYFCRYFKAATGVTPFQYLTFLRIEKAAHMLTSGSQKVSEVCYESGFENVSYFIRTFKKYKGMTPKAYSNSLLSRRIKSSTL